MIEKGHMIVNTTTGRFAFKPLEFFGVGYTTTPYNEVAAYNISEFFGFELVPHTEIKQLAPKMGSGVVFLRGSCQDFISAIPLNHAGLGNIQLNSVSKIIVFDTLIGNTDRKAENVLVGKDGRLYAIDNGFSLAFHLPFEAEKRETDSVFNTSLWDIANSKLGIDNRLLLMAKKDYLEELITTVQDNIDNLNTEGWYGDEYIEKEVLDALKHRAKYLPTIVWNQIRG